MVQVVWIVALHVTTAHFLHRRTPWHACCYCTYCARLWHGLCLRSTISASHRRRRRPPWTPLGVDQDAGSPSHTRDPFFGVSLDMLYYNMVWFDLQWRWGMEPKASLPVVGDLGWCMVQLSKQQYGSLRLTIVSAADEKEHGFIPAQSVSIYGEASIDQLRDFLNLHRPKETT